MMNEKVLNASFDGIKTAEATEMSPRCQGIAIDQETASVKLVLSLNSPHLILE